MGLEGVQNPSHCTCTMSSSGDGSARRLSLVGSNAEPLTQELYCSAYGAGNGDQAYHYDDPLNMRSVAIHLAQLSWENDQLFHT